MIVILAQVLFCVLHAKTLKFMINFFLLLKYNIYKNLSIYTITNVLEIVKAQLVTLIIIVEQAI